MSVTTANKLNRREISRVVFLFENKEIKRAVTYSVGTTLRTLLMHDKKKEKREWERGQESTEKQVTQRGKKERKMGLKGNNSLNSQIKTNC